MSRTHYAAVPQVGACDLLAFRDTAVSYAACRRQGGVLRWQISPQAAPLLSWLGVEGESGDPAGVCYLDPSREAPSGVIVQTLADGAVLQDLSLDALRTEGMLAEAVFAALIRSSYGPDGLDYFPTRSELGFYFEPEQLRSGTARWDQEYLQACQRFFMEELTPAELVEKSLASLPWEVGRQLLSSAQDFMEDLQAVTFFVAADLESLKPLATLLQALLSPSAPVSGLSELLRQGGPQPTRDRWEKAWNDCPQPIRDGLAQRLCPGFSERACDLLFTAGPRLLARRAGAPSEVVS